MSPASRRIIAYWLLLLVPTLVVGVGAIQLLRREQARLSEQESYAGQARRAAVAARAGLIVENMELLVGDVTAGLVDTLGSMPTTGLDAELALWQKSNPLVRTAFRCTPDGQIVYPSATGADEEVRAFRRRFAPLFERNAPWRKGEKESSVQSTLAGLDQAAGQRADENLARQQAYSNVAKVQNARREAQDLSKSKDYLNRASAPSAAAAEKEIGQLADKKSSGVGRDTAKLDENRSGKSGWLTWPADSRLHLIGWIEKPGVGEIRGVEVELQALIARLGGVLPAETGSGEGYALRDERGRIMHQVGWIPRAPTEATAQVAMSRDLLPGWEVIAYLDVPPLKSDSGSGFLLVGTLLVGILVVAILAGGSLLVWQARRSEAEAVQKTSFVANVSHEFKTPLTTVRLYAELLEQGRVKDAAKQGEYLRTIGQETQRLSRLVGNVLDFSRLEQGQKKYEIESLDLREEIGRLLDAYELRSEKTGLRLKRKLPAATVAFTTDRDAFAQILLNLLDNAGKYAASGGEIEVEAVARTGGGASVKVSDRGPGVPTTHQERIFEKFHRVDDTLTAEKAGTGLGLAIARQLARGLGGELRYETRDGGGAVFILELP